MKWIFGTIFVWLTFVMSLAAWWLYFGVNTLSVVAAVSEVPQELHRHQRMLVLEGLVLLVCLFVGGVALFYFSWRMYKEKSVKEIFFASFTHDIKTALFRLQLEVEKMADDQNEKEVEHILGHTRKMQLDLENSLDSTVGQNKELFLENVQLKNFFLDLHTQWPEFRICFSGEEVLPADRKALHSIFKNLLHNSFVHGGADEVHIKMVRDGSSYQIEYSDNGKPFEGSPANLGEMRNYSIEGSGFGLYIVRQWMSRLGGKLNFTHGDNDALKVVLQFPQRTLS